MKIIKNPTLVLLLLITALGTACGKSAAPAAANHEEKEAAEKAEHAEKPDADAAPHTAIKAQAAKDAGIEIRTAGPATLRETLVLYGVVQPNAERTRTVVARFPGVIKTISKTLGDKVSAGDVLATVESNDSLQTYAIKAPIAGVITARNANPGEAIGEQALFTITDLSSVWVDLALFPRDVAQVHTGQTVAVHAANGGPSSEGKLLWLSPVGSADTQSLVARVALDNREHQWTPGLYVTGEVLVGERPVALAVLSTALQKMEGKAVVFEQTKSGYEARTVKIGRSDGTLSEIVEGLALNARYVSANSFLIKADIEKSTVEDDD